ncbi:MAG: class I SAM-dependent methyltransferase, partial [Candidatus Electrothrix sp. ATG2]|nr:class I SAM-dependent methyltransferase [Candidatus Electrothrix sp. ATG2]
FYKSQFVSVGSATNELLPNSVTAILQVCIMILNRIKDKCINYSRYLSGYNKLLEKLNQLAEYNLNFERFTRVENINLYNQIAEHNSLVHFLNPRLPLPQLRGSVISPDYANKLVWEIMVNKPKNIMECGSGTSTIIASYCLEKLGGGHIISLDDGIQYAKRTRGYLTKHNLERFSSVYHTPLIDYPDAEFKTPWYDLSVIPELPKIDMLIIDGPVYKIDAEVRFPALPLLIEYLSDTAIIILDDAARIGEKAVVKKWLSLYSHFEYEYYHFEKGAVILRCK